MDIVYYGWERKLVAKAEMRSGVEKAKRKLSTDEIFKRIHERKPVAKEEIDFIEPKQLREELSRDIEKAGYSINAMASECCITQSQLNDFLNGKKQMSRDKVLLVFITLGYSITKIQRLLRRFGYGELYTRNQRDYIILMGIRESIGIDGIDERLERESLDTLWQKK